MRGDSPTRQVSPNSGRTISPLGSTLIVTTHSDSYQSACAEHNNVSCWFPTTRLNFFAHLLMRCISPPEYETLSGSPVATPQSWYNSQQLKSTPSLFRGDPLFRSASAALQPPPQRPLPPTLFDIVQKMSPRPGRRIPWAPEFPLLFLRNQASGGRGGGGIGRSAEDPIAKTRWLFTKESEIRRHRSLKRTVFD